MNSWSDDPWIAQIQRHQEQQRFVERLVWQSLWKLLVAPHVEAGAPK